MTRDRLTRLGAGLTAAAFLLTFTTPASSRTSLARVEGYVVARDGVEPVPGVRVELASKGSTSPTASAVTAADGSFAVTDLAGGSYAITLRMPDGTTESAGAVAVSPGVPVRLAVRLVPAATGGGGGGGGKHRAWIPVVSIVGGAVLFGALLLNSSDDAEGSPFKP